MMSYSRVLPLIGSALLAFAACGGDDKDDGDGGGGKGSKDNSDISLGSGNSTGVGSVSGTGELNACTSSFSYGEGCSGQSYEGENIPLDIYIMFDQSRSMGCVIEAQQPWDVDGECCAESCGQTPRITPVREALSQFLSDPQSNGINAGIGFFGHMRSGNTSCNGADYSNAAVGIGELPDHAGALLDSLNAVSPTGETPTGAAIRGACEYVNSWHEEHPTNKKVILLVTDGIPEAPNSDCAPSIQDASNAAEECYQGAARIPTYVLGVGQALGNLNQIAAAGGTEDAYLVDADVENAVLEALNAIRADAIIPCTLSISDAGNGEPVDYTKVNVGICDASGEQLTTFYVETANDCELGGWFYEDSADGKVIQLCDSTCETVEAAGSKLSFIVGCDTEVEPIR